MEANNPVFLPRLVPYIFSARRSTPQKSMSHSRSLTPMSTTEDYPPNPPPIIEVSSDSTPQLLAPRRMRHVIKTLFRDDPNLLTRILLDSYTMTPFAISSALSTLTLGTQGEQKMFAPILKAMWDSDPIIANQIMVDMFTQAPYNDDSASPGGSSLSSFLSSPAISQSASSSSARSSSGLSGPLAGSSAGSATAGM